MSHLGNIAFLAGKFKHLKNWINIIFAAKLDNLRGFSSTVVSCRSIAWYFISRYFWGSMLQRAKYSMLLVCVHSIYKAYLKPELCAIPSGGMYTLHMSSFLNATERFFFLTPSWQYHKFWLELPAKITHLWICWYHIPFLTYVANTVVENYQKMSH